MKKILITLAVVGFVNAVLAEAVDIYGGKHGDPFCKDKNEQHIKCYGDDNLNKYNIEIKYKDSCHYYRYLDPGYW